MAATASATGEYDRTWPERLKKAGYTFQGGQLPSDGSTPGYNGASGNGYPDYNGAGKLIDVPEGFTCNGNISLHVVPKEDDVPKVPLDLLFASGVLCRNPARKVESNTFTATSEREGRLVLDFGSFAIRDAIRARIINPLLLPLTYDPKWPERVINAGYTFVGGRKSSNGGPDGCTGGIGPSALGDGNPDGFVSCGAAVLSIVPANNAYGTAPKIPAADLFITGVFCQNPARKTDSSRFAAVSLHNGWLTLDFGSFAIRDAIRAGVLDPSLLPVATAASVADASSASGKAPPLPEPLLDNVPKEWLNTAIRPSCQILPLIPYCEPRDVAWDLMVRDRFTSTMSKTGEIVRIERIENVPAWHRYQGEKVAFAKKSDDDPERWLWHGTSKTHTESVVSNFNGIDITYAAVGLWGRGLYFASNASYSHNYAFTRSNGDRQMILCRVLTGKSVMLSRDSTLVRPPGDYDSVACDPSQCNGSVNFVLYQGGSRVYPAYLVTYRCTAS